MRFDRLHIPAFGPFTGLDIRFPSAGSDLQVIHGPNEAGKSSLLRAIRDLLFGIHGQSPDNFLHEYKQLRIGGEVVSRAGDRLAFQRRKGAKNTLLDADGNPLPDHALAPFLGSVDQAYFSTMFGLGTRELREGAEQLLRGEGDIGSALFSASLGGTPVQRVLAALTEESERYFKGKATANVSIRPAAARYRELLKQCREAAVSPEAWERIERELAAADEDKARLETELRGIDRQLEWLLRCEDALPVVGRLKEELRILDGLPPAPEVSIGFVERARAARKAAGEAQAEVRRLEAQIDKLRVREAACVTSPAMLESAEALERLHKDLGVYRDHQQSLVDLETELAGLDATLSAGVRSLGLTGGFSELEKLRLGSAVKLSCQESAERLDKAREALGKLQERMEDTRGEIETSEAQLEALPPMDLTALRDALALAAEATDASKTLPAAQSEVKRLRQQVRDSHEALTGAPEDWDATADLPVPGKSAIRRLGGAMDDIGRELKDEEARLGETKKRLDSVRAELARLERRGELPSEQALREARDRRDHGWELVLAEWKGGGAREEFVPDIPLEEAYPQTVQKADDIADRLRREAEAVAQAEEKRFQIGECQKELQGIEAGILAVRRALMNGRESWEAAWKPCGIVPGTAEEMEEWRETWSEFKRWLRQLRESEATFQRKQDQVSRAISGLAAVLAESGEQGFRVLFEKARRRVQEGEEQTGRRRAIEEQIQKLKTDLSRQHGSLDKLGRDVEAAQAQWRSQCLAAGLPEEVSPQSGLALLRERADLLARHDEWQKSSNRRRKLSERVQAYEGEVSDRSRALGIEGDTTEARVSRLWKALTRARGEAARRDQLQAQIEEAERELSDIQEARTRADQALEELIQQAKLETVEGLEPLLANLEIREQVQSSIATLRHTLVGLARGQTVDDFLSRMEAEEMESLPQRKRTLEEKKQEVEAALHALRDKLYGLGERRRTLEDSGDAAADYRQQAELLAARLKEDASRYVRLRLAVHFLQTQIERFRRENQGPLLEASGHVFGSITRGAFIGLGPEFRADDTPVLVGLRADGSKVPVSGMSDGTRDQLYLALRLAALDRYLDQHEPMPLILDDLLITFDDDRAAAILPHLAELARRTQILLFTHHDHLVDLCRGTLGEDRFHLHRLTIKVSE